jgi:Hpt domain
MTAAADSSVPLIDEALGDGLFSMQGDPEVMAAQQQIWQGVCIGIGPDLERALRGDFDDLLSELHRIRGYCSSCGLCRLAKLLYQWESEPCATSAAERLGPVAIETALLSIAALEARYPHLRQVSPSALQ